MNRLNITAKIWLSIGVFVAGFVVATALGQIQGRSTENTLRVVSEALFPSAQSSQHAAASFDRAQKGLATRLWFRIPPDWNVPPEMAGKL